MFSKVPGGTITFLFTDIEGSTKLWEQYPTAMQSALARHDQIMEAAIRQYSGQVVKKRGDGYHAAFGTPQEAASACIIAQQDLGSETWSELPGGIKVRMSLHTAAAKEREGDYYGTQLNRAARLQAAAHGGQILISMATRELLLDDLPQEAYLLDLGEHRLKDLSRPEHIYQLCAPTLAREFPPILSLDTVRTNLPVLSTSFVGRDQELAEISDLIANQSCRLLTLTGPGGIGKTRLAMQSAAECADCFPDGVYVVPLAPVSGVEFLATTIASELNFVIDTFSSSLDPKTQVLDMLRQRSMLLVLDNFEHLLDGTEILVEILASATGVKLLVTSRQLLNLQGEWTYNVPGLSYPRNGKVEDLETYSAVKLFIERARQVDPHFAMTDKHRLAVKRICQLLEGLPLGIELAAAWVSLLSPQEILEEIDKNIDFLASTRRDIEQKHRSLRAVFDASWRMLSEDQQAGFRKLSVFRGGFTRQAADSIVDLNLWQLSNLADKSMLRRSSLGRFSLHELLRAYAEEMLRAETHEWEEVHHKHSLYYLAFLKERLPELNGTHLIELREQLREEIENLRAAMFWIAIHGEADQVRSALHAYRRFFDVQGFHEGREVFRRIGDNIETRYRGSGSAMSYQDPVYLCARSIEAFFLSFLGEIETAEPIARQCLSGLKSLDLKLEHSLCYLSLGINATFRGDYEEGKKWLQHCMDISSDVHAHEITAIAMIYYGYIFHELGDYKIALEMFEKCNELFKSLDNLWGQAYALSKLGLVYDDVKDHPKALMYHTEAQKIFFGFGDKAGLAYTASRLGLTEFFLGDFEEAIRFGEIGLDSFTEIGHRWGMAVSFCRLGFPCMAIGNYEKARDYFFTALQRALENKMIPLALYALIGIACLFEEQHLDKRAAEIFAFVKAQPHTPPVYLAQGEIWFEKLISRLGDEGLAEAEASTAGMELIQLAQSVLDERARTGVA
jgi:predicted ATPase/class 3 adenylate cyclase